MKKIGLLMKFFGFHGTEPRLLADALLIGFGLTVECFLLIHWGHEFFTEQSLTAKKAMTSIKLEAFDPAIVEWAYLFIEGGFWLCVVGVIMHHYFIFRNFRLEEAKGLAEEKKIQTEAIKCIPAEGMCVIATHLTKKQNGRSGLEHLAELLIFVTFGIVNGELPYLLIVTGSINADALMISTCKQIFIIGSIFLCFFVLLWDGSTKNLMFRRLWKIPLTDRELNIPKWRFLFSDLLGSVIWIMLFLSYNGKAQAMVAVCFVGWLYFVFNVGRIFRALNEAKFFSLFKAKNDFDPYVVI